MTTNEITKMKAFKEINKSFEKNVEYVMDLKFRWLDEKDYEDFNEYKKVIINTFKKDDITVSKITKSFNIVLEKDVDEKSKIFFDTKFSANGAVKYKFNVISK